MRYNNWMEHGRSMMEMLSVLAIIGILSALGVAGYRTAMLRHHANETWESMLRFREVALERATINPDESCGGWYCSALKGAPGAPTNSSYCYLDRSDLSPSFANGYENYYMFVDTSDKNAQWRNIAIDGLCSSLLPDAKLKGSGTSAYLLKSVGDVSYKCYRKTVDVEWQAIFHLLFC